MRARDARADGSQREVFLARGEVLIRRRVAGIDMRLDVPARAYRGVLLSLDASEEGEALFRLSLLHGDPDLSVILQEAPDDSDIVAEWTSWARYFGVPRLVERNRGVIEPAEETCGAIALGRAFKLRRRGASLARRRPRLFMRRKTGDQSRVGKRLESERVIVIQE